MKQQNIDWSSYNGIYSHLVKSNLELSNQKLYDLLISTAIKNKHNFGNLLTVSRVKRYRNRVKYEAVKANPKKHNKTQQYVIDIQKEVIKKTRQNAFLNKHVRQEMTIDSTRESVVESLKYKLDRSEERKIKVPSLSNLKIEDSEDGYVLQHIMTDIHVNEVTIRKGGKTNWDTNKALKTVSNILNLLIEKQIKEKNKYSSLQLLLLGDLIGTKIHEGIVLDIESNRAAKFLASIIAQAVPTLIHYFGNVEIIIVP